MVAASTPGFNAPRLRDAPPDVMKTRNVQTFERYNVECSGASTARGRSRSLLEWTVSSFRVSDFSASVAYCSSRSWHESCDFPDWRNGDRREGRAAEIVVCRQCVEPRDRALELQLDHSGRFVRPRGTAQGRGKMQGARAQVPRQLPVRRGRGGHLLRRRRWEDPLSLRVSRGSAGPSRTRGADRSGNRSLGGRIRVRRPETGRLNLDRAVVARASRLRAQPGWLYPHEKALEQSQRSARRCPRRTLKRSNVVTFNVVAPPPHTVIPNS